MTELFRPKWRRVMAWARGAHAVRLERSGSRRWRIIVDGRERTQMIGALGHAPERQAKRSITLFHEIVRIHALRTAAKFASFRGAV